MEPFTNQEQWLLLLRSVLLGAGIGLLYDGLRALRRQFRCGPLATAGYDAVFWLVLLAGLFEFDLLFAVGQSRAFALAGAAAGAAVYFAGLSDAVLAALGGVLAAVVRLWRGGRNAARRVRGWLRRCSIVQKIQKTIKKFAKTPSLFRGKGIE
ncbi:MAG: spore cortex biosynthesis protein YabQ [Eubacteriales bacterium]|nr:spore cortex biosynthesis protein YabQ [Eubacteriales bacterium]